jgi:hypothetical protein
MKGPPRIERKEGNNIKHYAVCVYTVKRQILTPQEI